MNLKSLGDRACPILGKPLQLYLNITREQVVATRKYGKIEAYHYATPTSRYIRDIPSMMGACSMPV
jgi:hypothetical protein